MTVGIRQIKSKWWATIDLLIDVSKAKNANDGPLICHHSTLTTNFNFLCVFYAATCQAIHITRHHLGRKSEAPT